MDTWHRLSWFILKKKSIKASHKKVVSTSKYGAITGPKARTYLGPLPLRIKNTPPIYRARIATVRAIRSVQKSPGPTISNGSDSATTRSVEREERVASLTLFSSGFYGFPNAAKCTHSLSLSSPIKCTRPYQFTITAFFNSIFSSSPVSFPSN